MTEQRVSNEELWQLMVRNELNGKREVMALYRQVETERNKYKAMAERQCEETRKALTKKEQYKDMVLLLLDIVQQLLTITNSRHKDRMRLSVETIQSLLNKD